MTDIAIANLVQDDPAPQVFAAFDLTIDGLLIVRGVRLVRGLDGLGVVTPARPGTREPIIRFSARLQAEIVEAVLAEWPDRAGEP